MARRMKVEYSESTGLIGKSQKTDAKEEPGEKEPEKEETQDVDMTDSGTFKSEGKPRFDRFVLPLPPHGFPSYRASAQWPTPFEKFLYTGKSRLSSTSTIFDVG